MLWRTLLPFSGVTRVAGCASLTTFAATAADATTTLLAVTPTARAAPASGSDATARPGIAATLASCAVCVSAGSAYCGGQLQISASSLLTVTSNSSSNVTTYPRSSARPMATSADSPLLFRQLFDDKSCTYTYLLADKSTKEAVIIDPVIDKVDRDVALIKELGLTLRWALNTHLHADHVTGTGVIKKLIPGAASVISRASGAKADRHIEEGDEVEISNKFKLRVLATPGHTDGCVSYVQDNLGFVFTGDAVLIRGCGRTDFQQGSPERLYESVHSRIFTLPESYIVYPAHDYKGLTASTVGEEKRHNPRLAKSLEEFVNIMHNLKLSYPKQIDVALPLNRVCGIQELCNTTQKHD